MELEFVKDVKGREGRMVHDYLNIKVPDKKINQCRFRRIDIAIGLDKIDLQFKGRKAVLQPHTSGNLLAPFEFVCGFYGPPAQNDRCR